ncbi:DDE_3 domain-containing protein [Trichonephila clavipes]|nr:DDE_3 domain-containing protein [Trichonephila clavipes]
MSQERLSALAILSIEAEIVASVSYDIILKKCRGLENSNFANVHAWSSAATACDSRSTLIVMRGTLTGQRYVDDILRHQVGPFLNGLPGAIFHQNNARPYTARVSQDFLRHFQTLPSPARSPDLSPVEHVWDQLKR